MAGRGDRHPAPGAWQDARVSPDIEQISTRIGYQSPWLQVREDEIRFGDGSPGLYSYIDKPDFALVVPYQDGGYWLVEQYRYPVRRRQWEFPQGGWPAGASGSQADLAATELREEVGARAGRWTHLGHQYASYGYSNQGYDCYLAEELTVGQPHREASEQDMRTAWFSQSDVVSMIADGTLQDAHSVAAWTLLSLHRAAARG